MQQPSGDEHPPPSDCFTDDHFPIVIGTDDDGDEDDADADPGLAVAHDDGADVGDEDGEAGSDDEEAAAAAQAKDCGCEEEVVVPSRWHELSIRFVMHPADGRCAPPHSIQFHTQLSTQPDS